MKNVAVVQPALEVGQWWYPADTSRKAYHVNSMIGNLIYINREQEKPIWISVSWFHKWIEVEKATLHISI